MMYGLTTDTIQAIQEVFSKYPEVEKAILYGSRAKGNYRPGSDIDLTVQGDQLTLTTLQKIENELDDLLLPYKIDLSVFQHIGNPDLIAHIERVGQVFYQKVISMSEWRFDEVADIVDCEHKTAPTVDFSHFYSVRTTNISGGKIDFENCNRVDEEVYKEWTKRAIPEAGDIILAREAPVGEVGIIKKGYKVCLGQRTVLIKLTSAEINNEYLLYYLVNPTNKNQLIEMSGGSVVSHLNMKDIREYILKLPPLPEQTAIAAILSSLDDKIDLLHRQNATLEKMAETLFRQWFVEEAKEEWEISTLYDAIELVGGGTPKTSVDDYWNGKIKWLSGGDIANNHKSIVSHSEKTITAEGLKNSSAKLLPKFSTIISARGTVGKYCLLSEPMAYSQSNYGILPKYKDCYFFTYLLVAHSVDELQSAAYGSVFDTITTNTFKGLAITLPAEEDIIRFNKSVEPYFFKILTNQTQIRTLTALRDTLLPKLMSGELRVDT